MTTFDEVFEARTEADRKALALEALALSIQVALQNSMAKHSVSQKELASRLGVSPARVSQILGGHASNLTLNTVAKVAHALGEDFEMISKVELKQLRKDFAKRDLRCLSRVVRDQEEAVSWKDTSANENRYPSLLVA